MARYSPELIHALRLALAGFLMGVADLVPGVSGGTVALVLGIYERLVQSIREGGSALGEALRARFRRSQDHLAAVEWSFLLPLLAGIGLAIVSLARVIEHQLEESPRILAGLFLGLVVASVAVAWRRIAARRASHVLIALTVATVLFFVLGLGERAAEGSPSQMAFLGAGALAICAMILPGISGSLILLMVGMYAPVLGAVTAFDLGVLAVFALGAIVGLALFSQVLDWALETHHDYVMAGLVGLMAGSLRILWPWPDGVLSPLLEPPAGGVLGVLVAAGAGALAVWAIARIAPQD